MSPVLISQDIMLAKTIHGTSKYSKKSVSYCQTSCIQARFLPARVEFKNKGPKVVSTLD
jgi:hypothetical protein